MSHAKAAYHPLSVRRTVIPATLALATALPISATAVLVRTWSRGSSSDVGAAALLPIVAAFLGCAVAVRLGWRFVAGQPNSGRSESVTAMAIIVGGPAAALAAVGLCLSATGMQPSARFLVWLLFAVEEGVSVAVILGGFRGMVLRRGIPRRAGPQTIAGLNEAAPLVLPERAADTLSREEQPNLEQLHEAAAGQVADGFAQTQIRCSDADSETVTGFVRTRAADGQRSLRLHVGFCPPLPQAPEVDIDVIEGDASVTAGQVLPQGIRFDVRVRPSGDPAGDTVLLRYEAVAGHPTIMASKGGG
jgi:hypothetical protein